MNKARIPYVIFAALLIALYGCQPASETVVEHGGLMVAEPNESMDGEWITYGDGFKGYLVRPTREGRFPAVLMIHEWWGLNQNIKNMAHDLAKEGFVVLAVDLYDGKVANTSEEARRYIAAVNNTKAIANMKSAVQLLRSHQDTTGKVASLGWCFGGGMSLQLSLNEELDATAIYYGNLVTDAERLQEIKSPVLGIFGAEDTSIPVESVQKFDSALDSINVTNEIYVYDGVGHAFANPSNPGHDTAKTEDAWMKTVHFLNNNLKRTE